MFVSNLGQDAGYTDCFSRFFSALQANAGIALRPCRYLLLSNSSEATQSRYWTNKTNSVTFVRNLTIPTERPMFVGEVSGKFCNRGCRVASAGWALPRPSFVFTIFSHKKNDPHGRILSFLDRSRYYFFQAAPQLYSRGWVDPVADPLFLR
jgi:hypothetical protein